MLPVTSSGLTRPRRSTVVLVVYFCVMQQILLEVPLLGYVFAPAWTQDIVARFKAWLSRS